MLEFLQSLNHHQCEGRPEAVWHAIHVDLIPIPASRAVDEPVGSNPFVRRSRRRRKTSNQGSTTVWALSHPATYGSTAQTLATPVFHNVWNAGEDLAPCCHCDAIPNRLSRPASAPFSIRMKLCAGRGIQGAPVL